MEKTWELFGIIGPTRMDYSKVISVLKYINREFNKGTKLTEIKFPKMLSSRKWAIKIRSQKSYKKKEKVIIRNRL